MKKILNRMEKRDKIVFFCIKRKCVRIHLLFQTALDKK